MVSPKILTFVTIGMYAFAIFFSFLASVSGDWSANSETEDKYGLTEFCDKHDNCVDYSKFSDKDMANAGKSTGGLLAVSMVCAGLSIGVAVMYLLNMNPAGKRFIVALGAGGLTILFSLCTFAVWAHQGQGTLKDNKCDDCSLAWGWIMQLLSFFATLVGLAAFFLLERSSQGSMGASFTSDGAGAGYQSSTDV